MNEGQLSEGKRILACSARRHSLACLMIIIISFTPDVCFAQLRFPYCLLETRHLEDKTNKHMRSLAGQDTTERSNPDYLVSLSRSLFP